VKSVLTIPRNAHLLLLNLPYFLGRLSAGKIVRESYRRSGLGPEAIMALAPRPYGLGPEAIPRAVTESKSGGRVAGADNGWI
jgi:hypothetical protein